MNNFTPREIVSELDRFIVGQNSAKRAVAVALRNRWRRQQVDPDLREEIAPKNIIMMGPTGVGKTEIARRLGSPARLRHINRSVRRETAISPAARRAAEEVYKADFDALLAAVGGSCFQAERKLFGFDHAELAAAVATGWRFPDDLVQCFRWHHEASHASEAAAAEGKVIRSFGARRMAARSSFTERERAFVQP